MSDKDILRSVSGFKHAQSQKIKKEPRHKLIAIASILVCVAIIAICFLIFRSAGVIDMTVSNLPDTQQIKGISSKTYTKTVNGMIVNETYPETSFARYNKTIRKGIDSISDTASKNSNDNESLFITYSCTLFGQRLLSTVINGTVVSNDLTVNNYMKTYIYDISTNKFVSPSEILSADAQTYVLLSDSIKECLSASDDQRINPSILKDVIKPDPVSFSNIAVSGNYIHFLYNTTDFDLNPSATNIVVSCTIEDAVEEGILDPELFADTTDTVDSYALPEPTMVNTEPLPSESIISPKKLKPKTVALTFDDGPSAATTPKLLKVLRKYGVKVTFFTLGNNVAVNKKIVKTAYKDGHEIAIHSMGHTQLTRLSSEAVRNDLRKCKKILKSTLGADYVPRSMRPPYGSYNSSVLKVCKKEDLSAYMWSMDTLDWKYRDKKRNIDYVTKHVKKKDIILMHDIHQTSVDSVEKIIINLSKKGYEFATVSELIGNPKPGKIYFSGKK